MQVRTYLSIRSDPARASTTLEKELTFDDLTVSSCNFMQTYHISCNFMQTYHTCEGTLSINRGKVSIDRTKKVEDQTRRKKIISACRWWKSPFTHRLGVCLAPAYQTYRFMQFHANINMHLPECICTCAHVGVDRKLPFFRWHAWAFGRVPQHSPTTAYL